MWTPFRAQLILLWIVTLLDLSTTLLGFSAGLGELWPTMAWGPEHVELFATLYLSTTFLICLIVRKEPRLYWVLDLLILLRTFAVGWNCAQLLRITAA